MSYKGIIENKDAAPVPRELRDLLEVTEELRQATALRAKERAASLVEQIQRAWGLANTLQLKLSAEGGHGEMLVRLADGLNSAQATRGNALFLINSLGTVR